LIHYEFPVIRHLDEVAAIVDGVDGFSITRKADYTVVGYHYNTPEVFPEVLDDGDLRANHDHFRVENFGAMIRRECRGLIFDLDGRLVSRPFHKFFNVNERDETQQNLLDLTRPHRILEKLDGSMIRPIPIGAGYRLATKAGVTDVAMQAEVFLAQHPNYDAFIRHEMTHGHTPIFEWCSRKQRIVLDYPEDRLVLTAVRVNETGEYLSLDWAREFIATNEEFHGVEVVQEFPAGIDSMSRLQAEAQGIEGAEGWIIRFEDGHMVKVKAEWYVLRHKSKDQLSREKNVVAMLVGDAVDDVKALLIDEDRHRLDRFSEVFWHGLNAYAADLSQRIEALKAQAGGDRKTFAVEYAKQLSQAEQGIAFGTFGGKAVDKQVLDVIIKNTSTQTRLEEVRYMWGGHRWEYNFDSDA
jgi:RNA ligase